MSATTRLLSMSETLILLCQPCVGIPQTEKMRSTKAFDTGAATTSKFGTHTWIFVIVIFLFLLSVSVKTYVFI